MTLSVITQPPLHLALVAVIFLTAGCDTFAGTIQAASHTQYVAAPPPESTFTISRNEGELVVVGEPREERENIEIHAEVLTTRLPEDEDERREVENQLDTEIERGPMVTDDGITYNADFDLNSRFDHNVQVNTPNDMNLILNTANSSVSVTNWHGGVTITDDDGRVRASNGSGSLVINDGEGDITITNWDGHVEITSSKGDVTLENVTSHDITQEQGKLIIDDEEQ